MNITGTAYLFVKKWKAKKEGDKDITIFETSISRKEDDEYTGNYYLRVNFTEKALSNEQRAKFKEELIYQIEILKGFLTTREGKDGENLPCILVQEFKLKGKTPSKRKPSQKKETKEEPSLDDMLNDDDLPFIESTENKGE